MGIDGGVNRNISPPGSLANACLMAFFDVSDWNQSFFHAMSYGARPMGGVGLPPVGKGISRTQAVKLVVEYIGTSYF